MNYIITCVACVLVIAEASDVNVLVDSNGVEVDAEKCLPDGPSCHIKCCAHEQVFHYYKKTITCINKTEKRELIDLNSIETELKNYSDWISETKRKDLMFYKSNVDFKLGVNVFVYEDAEVDNNVIGVQTDEDFAEVRPPSYCYEMFVAYNTKSMKTITFYGHLVDIDDNNQYTKILLSAYGCLVSAFFILLVLIVYCLLKPLRSTVYGTILMWFLSSLMMLQLIDSGTNIYENWLVGQGREEEKLLFCPWLSPIVYFLLLSTFFWINAMCFEIWRTFKKSTMVRSDSANRRRVAMRAYLLHALGGPAVLTAVALAVDHADTPGHISKPAFQMCMHDSEDKVRRLYKYLPMGVLVTGSVVLYTLTVYNIWGVNRVSRGVTSTQAGNKKQFAVYGRLSVLMGVNWILELVQAMVVGDIPVWLTYIIDFYNVFIGVIIFFTMVFKKSIFIMLCQRLNIENRWVRQSTVATSSQKQTSKSFARTKTTNDSIEFDSMNTSQAFVSPNPRFTITKV